MSTTVAYDATTGNTGTLPAGQHAGYTTGPGISWTQAQFDADPGAVRICQDPAASDKTADVLDVEPAAATVADVVAWYRDALASYRAGSRPGQRSPMIYCSPSSLTPIANAFTAAGISGVPIWIAKPGTPVAQAQAIVAAASGPFPELGVQNAWFSTYDENVFSSAWLTAQSGIAGQTVAISSSGPAVHALQARLNVWHTAKGTNPQVTVDGLFGVATQAAVKSFQEALTLTVDGIAGPLTWAHLNADPVKPPVQSAPLSVTPNKEVTTVYELDIDREIPGYTGAYQTTATGVVNGKPWSYTAGTRGGQATVTVPGPGTYTVTTSAAGYSPAAKTVSVLA